MTALTPAWEQQTAEDTSSSHGSLKKADEVQRASRRRISSSLAPWEKPVTSESSPSHALGAEEQSSGTPLLTRLGAIGVDDESKKQNNANDDVEHEPESANELALNYHYTGQETSEDPQNGSSNNHTRRYSRISMIIIYGREALCILALILTTYASIQNR